MDELLLVQRTFQGVCNLLHDTMVYQSLQLRLTVFAVAVVVIGELLRGCVVDRSGGVEDVEEGEFTVYELCAG